MSQLNKLFLEGEKKNINYLSDVSLSWYANYMSSMSETDRTKIRNEILKKSSTRDFIKGNFYYFDYLPKEMGDSNFERYDRKPFIFAFKKIGDTIHGINLNYLPPIDRIFLINKMMLFLVGNYISESVTDSRLALTYEMMKLKSNFYEQNIVYRKYLISRGKNYKLIPIKYMKIFSVLGNISGFPISETVIYKEYVRQRGQYNIKNTKKRKRKI